ncbi:MAG: RHS repeat-associated core domain-containing protein, partial [Cyanobacteria bacterium J06642_9]
SVSDVEAGLTTYSYDPVGNRILTEFGNGTRESSVYDELNRLVSLQQSHSDGELFARYDYTLDAVGNRIQVVELDGRQVNYTFDSTYRLLSESISDPLAGARSIEFSYDAVGNRLTRDDSVEGETQYTYNDNNQLVSKVDGDGVTTTFSYDDNGNLIRRENENELTEYSFDIENRLVEARITQDGATQVATYVYDDYGIRVGSTVDGEETLYLIDPNRPYAQVLEEYNPEGEILNAYVYGDELIARVATDGTVTFFHADALGSTRVQTDSSGEVIGESDFDAFGRELRQEGTETEFQFAGEQRDNFVGLDYLRARYYDPDLGRFISRDPFSGFLDRPISLHKYQYADNNPVNNTDPSGLVTLTEISAARSIRNTLAGIQGTGGLTAQGAFNRALQGEEITIGSVVKDILLGVVIDLAAPFVLDLFAQTLSVGLRAGGRFIGDALASTSRFVDDTLASVGRFVDDLLGGPNNGLLPNGSGGRFGDDLPRSSSTNLDSFQRWEEYAPEAYQAIRNSSDDVTSIARNTGFPERRIQRIKDHLFNNQHQLDSGISYFDPDPDIADAWGRLQNGTHNLEDIRLLNHEYFESRFEGIFRTDYRTAHNATNRSGRTWQP